FDGADEGDGLAAELEDSDGDFGLLDVFAEARDNFGFELFDGEAGGLYAAGEGKADVTAHIDADGLIAEFLAFEGVDGDLIVGSEEVGGGDLAGDGRRGGG